MLLARFLVILYLTVLPFVLLAQNNLDASYANLNAVPDFLNVCGDPEEIIVRIATDGFSGSTRSDISAQVQFFAGVKLVNWNAEASSLGVQLTNNSNPNQPIFSIPDLSPTGTNFVDIAMTIAADCGYTDTLDINDQISVFDTWHFNYTLDNQALSESDATAEYRDAFAVPFFTMELVNDNAPARVLDCGTRTVQVNNSALQGFTDQLIYAVVQESGVAINEVLVNNMPIDLTKSLLANGDSLIVATIDGSYFEQNNFSNNDGFFDPNESLIISENYCIVGCALGTLSTHTIAWGCDGSSCREAIDLDFVLLGEGHANLEVEETGTLPDEQAGYCEIGRRSITFSNNGVEFDEGFATMFDVEAGIGLASNFDLSANGYSITSMSIGGLQLTDYQAINALEGNMQFTSDPDGAGGLSDADGDGFFDDLPLGESFEVVVEYAFDCLDTYTLDAEENCTNDFTVSFNTRCNWRNACGDMETRFETNFFRPSNNNSGIENSTTTDAYTGGEIFYVTHEESRSVRFFDVNCNGEERFFVQVVLPQGIQPAIAETSLLKNGQTPVPFIGSSISNDTLRLEYDASFSPFLNGDYTIQLAFTADCTAALGETFFPILFEFYCPSCDCRHLWYCENLPGPTLHPTSPPCPPLSCPQGLQTTAFSVNRTTFGFTDATYSTPVVPAEVDTKVAISCDSIEMRVQNKVGASAITDDLGIVISYDNVDESYDATETFLFGSGEVRFMQNGTDFFCDITPDMLTVEAVDSTKILTFQLGECLNSLGLTLQPEDEVEFIGHFAINPDGPFSTQFRVVPNIRAYGFAVFNGEAFACDNFGENLTIAKTLTAFDFPNSNNFPEGCVATTLQYRLITVNNGFSDFFPNEYRQATRIDSITFDFDPAFLDAFHVLNMQVAIPGHPIFGNNFYDVPPLSDFPNGHYSAQFDTLAQVPSLNDVQSYSFNLRLEVLPTCESTTGSSNGTNQYNFDPTIHYQDRYYAHFIGDGTCAQAITDEVDNNITYTEPPILTLAPVSNTNFILLGDTAEWTIQTCNASFESDAELAWLAIEDFGGTVNVISMEDVTNPNDIQSLDVQYYGQDDLFAFAYTNPLLKANGLNGFDDICNLIRVKALVNQCVNANFDAITGWSCAPYSDPNWTPDLYEPCIEDNLQLTVTLRNPLLEANMIDQANTPPAICETETLTVLLRNTDRGAAYNIKTQIILPILGAELVPGSVEIAYPSSAPFQPATADPVFVETTLQGDIYQYDNFEFLDDYLHQNGLAGFKPNMPSDSNELIIRYAFQTDCDFRSGDLSYYNFQGEKGCGDLSNFEAGESLPLIIDGADPDPNKLFQVFFSSGSVLLSNQPSDIEINVVNLTSTPSEDTDFVSLTLPPGVEYVPGSTVAIQPGNWILGEPEIILNNGLQIMTWQLPAGLLIGEQATLQLQVNSPQLDCELSGFAVLLATESQHILFCADGSIQCDISTITSVTGAGLTELTVGGNLTLNFAEVTSQCLNNQQETVTLTGLIASPNATFNDQTYNIIVYYDANQNGLIDEQESEVYAAFFAGDVSPDNDLPFTFSFPANIDETCFLIAEITVNDIELCGQLEMLVPIPSLQNAGEDQVFCATENTTISTQIGEECITDAPYSFNWIAIAPASTDDLSATNILQPSLNIPHNAAFTDTLTYVLQTTRNECTQSFDTIRIIRSGGLEIASANPVSIVLGQSTTLEPTITGGIAPLSYQWLPTNTLNNSSILSPEATPTQTTTYTLNVSDAIGCEATGNFEIIIAPPIEIDINTSDTTLCANENLQLVASGGTNYEWIASPNNPTENNLDNSTIANPTFSDGTPNSTYEYQVIVTDAAFPNVADTAQVSIQMFPVPTLEMSENSTICFGETASISATATGGSGIITYEWSPAVLFGQFTDEAIVQPTETTTYTLTISDENGCTTTNTILMTVENCNTCIEPAIVSTQTTPTECGFDTGAATINITQNLNEVSFIWSPDMGIGNANTASNLPLGNYEVTIQNNDDPTCQTTTNLTIGTSDGPQPSISTTPATCESANGTASLNPTDLQYLWNDGNTDAIRSNLAAQTYVVTVTDPANPLCPNIIEVAIPLANPLVATVNILQEPTCQQANGTAQIEVTGGSGNYGYSWPSNSDTQSNLTSGIYNITVTDLAGDGCQIPVLFVLTDDVPEATITITDTTHIACFGEENGAIAFNIDFDNAFAQPADTIFSNGIVDNFVNGAFPAGEICIAIRDANGCIAGGLCFEINEPEPLSAQITTTTSCGTDGTIAVLISGGVEPYQYDWSNTPLNLPNQSDLAPGSYPLTITDANNCTLILDEITVDVCTVCDLFEIADTLLLQAQNCSETTAICLHIPPDELGLYELTDNGLPFNNFTNCSFDTIGVYGYSNLFGQGNSGPYMVDSWPINSTSTFSGQFLDIQSLVDSMNLWDTQGNWVLNPPFIIGGFSGNDYQEMQVTQISLDITSTIGYNPQFTPTGLALNLATGFHEIIATSTVSNCIDTLYATVFCVETDTIYIELDEFELDTICLTSEALNGPIVSIENNCPTNENIIILDAILDTCFQISAQSIGQDTACFVACDDFGICDTTIVIIDVFNNNPADISDTILITQTQQICFDTSLLSLQGELASIQNICPEASGEMVEFTTTDDPYCVIYEGFTLGTDTACLQLCDDLGFCDTLNLFVTVVNGQLLYDTICLGADNIVICADTSILAGNIVSSANICPEDSGNAVLFSIESDSLCVRYEALAPGTDTACVRIEDDLGNLVLNYHIVTVLQLQPDFWSDTIYIAEIDTFCLDTTELTGNLIFADDVCFDNSTGNVDFFYNPNTHCIEYMGMALGRDTSCMILCDDRGCCDTTYFSILVEEYFDPPIANDDTLRTDRSVPVVIDIKQNDIIFGGIVNSYILNPPLYGTATINPDCSVTYIPFDEYCEREDAFTYVICNPNGCDTATVEIYIECLDIRVFTAVSPNNDDINDFFFISNITRFTHQLDIYNRWGNLVYSTDAYDNKWPGTWNNEKDLPDGAYFYILEWSDEENESGVLRGYLEIVR